MQAVPGRGGGALVTFTVRRPVNNKPPRHYEPVTTSLINLRSGSAMVVAATLGAMAGAIAASKLSSEAFAWTGFFLVPLFLLLEVSLKHLMAHFGGNRDVARFTLAAAIVAGFYGAWFGLRSL